jgi:hypothetical protein
MAVIDDESSAAVVHRADSIARRGDSSRHLRQAKPASSDGARITVVGRRAWNGAKGLGGRGLEMRGLEEPSSRVTANQRAK